jgi:hypothetical protein
MLKVVLSNRPILHTLNVTVILTFNPCRSLSLLKTIQLRYWAAGYGN